MKKIAQFVFWLSLFLMTMILAGCSTTVNSDSGCLEYPRGGAAMGGVYKRLPHEDKKIATEYFNRLHSFFQLPAFCQN